MKTIEDFLNNFSTQVQGYHATFELEALDVLVEWFQDDGHYDSCRFPRDTPVTVDDNGVFAIDGEFECYVFRFFTEVPAGNDW